MEKNKPTTIIPWREFSKDIRPEYNQSVIMLTKDSSIITGRRTNTDYKGNWYESINKGDDTYLGWNKNENQFIAWVPFKEIIDSYSTVPDSVHPVPPAKEPTTSNHKLNY